MRLTTTHAEFNGRDHEGGYPFGLATGWSQVQAMEHTQLGILCGECATRKVMECVAPIDEWEVHEWESNPEGLCYFQCDECLVQIGPDAQ